MDKVKKAISLLITDPLSARVFFDCGIVDGLHEILGDRLEVVFLLGQQAEQPRWVAERTWLRFRTDGEVLNSNVRSVWNRIHCQIDSFLDRIIGYYPLAIRFNLRNSFHLTRMANGHKNNFLNTSLKDPFPAWDCFYNLMMSWIYSDSRFVDPAIRRYIQQDVSGIVVSNLQYFKVVPYLITARKMSMPMVGYIASWDHLVGKGVVFPSCSKYVVQSEIMKSDLKKYHGIDEQSVVVTGWPQTDVFAKKRSQEEYASLLRSFDLDVNKPCVLVAGNTPANAPFEPLFVKRLIGWWKNSGGSEKFNIILRPHPRDTAWQDRFSAGIGLHGVYVQPPSYTDIDVLGLLLQHVDCVLANAGTVLLDSLVNNRPAVCVLYDEGAPEDTSFAIQNVSGKHYEELMASGAFHVAKGFQQVVEGIETCLSNPLGLEDKRRKVIQQIVGNVDGKAAQRVVEAIVGCLCIA